MEATGSSGMLVNICFTKHYHISEDSNVHNHCHENFKSHISESVLGYTWSGYKITRLIIWQLPVALATASRMA
jgi:hypothetical protein